MCGFSEGISESVVGSGGTMRRAFSAFCLLLVLVMVNVLTGFPTEGGGRRAHAQGASTVLDVRVGDHGDKTRYVLEMTRSEEHTSELQSLMRISYAVFCLKKKKTTPQHRE